MNPLDASSADLGRGVAEPALVFGNFKFASPLFALIPGLTDLYRVAPFLLCFLLATLQAQWTYTGYDASAHVAEETVMARLNSAWGVFLSVAVSAVVGYIVLLALTWSIPEGKGGRNRGRRLPGAVHRLQQPVDLLRQRRGDHHRRGDVALRSGLDNFDGRMWYAFARDDGMPGSRLIKQVSPNVPDSGLVDRHHQRARGADLPLRLGVLRGDVDQHHHPLPGLYVPDLSQLAEQAPRPGGIHHAGDGALEHGPVGAAGERRSRSYGW